MTSFSKIYSVSADVETFAMLQETTLELAMQSSDNELYSLNGQAKGALWQAVAVDWLTVPGMPSLPHPDIAAWGAISLAVNAERAALLEPALGSSCELLPLNLNGVPWRAINVLARYQAIDDQLTERRCRADGRPDRIRPFKRLVLNGSAISTGGLFRIEGAGLRTYCTDQQGGFLDVVTRHNLQGLTFTEQEVRF